MAETPNRMTAYNQARAAAGPQKGMNYSELFVDNIFGLDNNYLSAGEKLKQAINSDPLGFLKNAGISAYEGAKQAVTQPLTTAEALMSGMYDSVVDVASTLGPDPAYLNDALQEMYGVTYDEATDEQVTAAREALFGDVFNVAGIGGPAALAAKTLVRGVGMPDPRVRPRGTGGAVIRRDDQFRGEGDMPISYISEGKTPADFSGQFAIRTTKQDQIDDIIQSGLVRQKKGGYGPKQKSTLYFGVQGSPETKVGISPGNLSGTSPYALVAKADEAAKYDNQGGIPLDALQHIWTLRDGKMTDILDEVKAKNREFEAEPSKSFNNGGEVDSNQGSNSILDLDPEAFLGALDELGLTGEERRFQTDQYFAKNRLLPMTSRPEGMKVRTILPIATPPGVTGAEALMSGNFDFTTPELLRAIYEGPAEAINVLTAIGRGIPLTKSQIQDAAMVFPEMMTGLGAAKSVVRGIGAPDPSVVSMSGVGPRGMGDNGGPSLESQRYINPNTGMYSPSYEASKSLKQEVGTPQQMRAMLLKAGAKEEELLYSGFDNWLKGKDKVTKKEIEDVLRISAAGDDPSGSMPYVQKQYSSKGLTGYEDQDPYVLRRTLAQDIQSQARDERDARIFNELQGRGYRPMKFADEAEFRDMLKRVREAYSTNLPGLGTDGESRLRLSRVLNSLKRAENLMDLDNLDFASRDVQRALQKLSDDNDFLIGPSNLPESSEDIIRRELPEEYRNPYFGSLPIEDRARISDEVNRMSEQELADRLGIDVEDVLNSFDETETEYGAYIVPGMRNYKENLYTYEDAGRGVMSGIEALGVSRFQQPHFSRQGSKNAPIMFSTRTGELQTPEGPAYHMFEAQSDIAQTYRDRPGDFVAPGGQEEGSNLAGKTGALPFSSSTNRWLDAALKSELIKAAKSDAQWFTLPKGKDVARMVGGDERGQEKFYEGIVPQRLKKLAKDFLTTDVELTPIKAKGYGSRGEEYDVLGMRLTPEIKKAILEGGFPSFAKGGPVKGSSLDVDVFALP